MALKPDWHDSLKTVQAHLDEWQTAVVERDVFGTDRASDIVRLTEEFCRAHLGSGLRGSIFYLSSVGCTHGVELQDGRRVVIKARPPATPETGVRLDRLALESIVEITGWLADRGYSCPRPLLGPTPLACGLATVETLMESGQRGDGFDPACRRTIAHGLARAISLLRDIPGNYVHLTGLKRGDSLFPQPHSRLFDFEATASGAEWIDAYARRALPLDTDRSAPTLGHSDWKVEHLRFQDGAIVASFDWDSLAMRRETELVGGAAHGFTADWTIEGVRRIPAGDDIRAFVADYEAARGRPFSRRERASVFANAVYVIAYGARCAHALAPATRDWRPDTWPYLLRGEGDSLLREAAE